MTWKDCLDSGGALDTFAVAGTLYRARQAGSTLDQLLSAELGLSLADAYRVQDQMTAIRLASGERITGWKLGYTSAVMRAQMGVASPNFGPLTDVMILDSPAVLPSGALQPRVEPEIGLRLGRRLSAPFSVGEAVESGTGAAASGHPAAGVAWLAEQLAGRGRWLEAGDLVITGGLTSAPLLEPGHRISASFGDGRWTVEVRRP
jgi:2-keto-4-pentenoate hydratase